MSFFWFLFHSFQLPLHVPVIFSVCPLHFPCMSRSFVASHFPTSPVVPIGCLVLGFPFIPPALHLFSFLSLSCPFQFPFVPFHFPLLFCHVDFPFLPSFSCTSLHFPFAPQHFPQNNAVFPAFSQRGRPTTQSVFQIFGKRRRAGRGIRAWDSPKTTFSGTSSNYRAERGGPPPPPPVPYVRGGGLRGGYPLSSPRCPLLGARHAEQCRRMSRTPRGSQANAKCKANLKANKKEKATKEP